jgi:hypothetical protein
MPLLPSLPRAPHRAASQPPESLCQPPTQCKLPAAPQMPQAVLKTVAQRRSWILQPQISFHWTPPLSGSAAVPATVEQQAASRLPDQGPIIIAGSKLVPQGLATGVTIASSTMTTVTALVTMVASVASKFSVCCCSCLGDRGQQCGRHHCHNSPEGCSSSAVHGRWTLCFYSSAVYARRHLCHQSMHAGTFATSLCTPAPLPQQLLSRPSRWAPSSMPPTCRP